MGVVKNTFPKLFGMNIGAKNYDNCHYIESLAKLDAVVLGFVRGWVGANGETAQDIVRAIKRINPDILLGQYTVLGQTTDNPIYTAKEDLREEVETNNWWLLNEDGAKLQWSSYPDNWVVNFTDFVQPNSNGDKYPQFYAKRQAEVYFNTIHELDIWYHDNVFEKERVDSADWKQAGNNIDSDDPEVLSQYRLGYVAHWQKCRELHPTGLMMGNIDHDLDQLEYKDQLNGAFLENLYGHSWSVGDKHGWFAVMSRYRAALANTVSPKLVVFHVSGTLTDYRLFRFTYASALLDDGWYAFTDIEKGYSSVPWFDEYDVCLGRSVDPPQFLPNNSGLYIRGFERGVVIVNPTSAPIKLRVSGELFRLNGTQSPGTNNGALAKGSVIQAKDGLILRRQLP